MREQTTLRGIGHILSWAPRYSRMGVSLVLYAHFHIKTPDPGFVCGGNATRLGGRWEEVADRFSCSSKGSVSPPSSPALAELVRGHIYRPPAAWSNPGEAGQIAWSQMKGPYSDRALDSHGHTDMAKGGTGTISG